MNSTSSISRSDSIMIECGVCNVYLQVDLPDSGKVQASVFPCNLVSCGYWVFEMWLVQNEMWCQYKIYTGFLRCTKKECKTSRFCILVNLYFCIVD